ncbi:MAG: DUF4168 domain-containing protein [Desulfosalsimonadaceae bacterium]
MRKATFLSQLKSSGKIAMLSLLLVFGLAIPGMAQDYGAPEGQQGQQEYNPQDQQQQNQQQQDPWEQQQADPADFSEEEIDKVAGAYVDIIDIREGYQEKLANVKDPDEAQQIQMEANEKITETVEENGVSVETYNNVITAAQSDEGLMNDLLSKIDALQQ